MKYTNENGRSMVEMLGVLAIIGVLSVGGIAGYSKAMNTFKINKTTDQVSMLVANLRTMFSAQGDYAGLDSAQAIKFGVVPDDMVSGTNSSTITNAFGGEVTIAASDLQKEGDNGAFELVYENLSQEACVTIATGDWGSGQASGLVAIAAGTETNVGSGKLKTVYIGNKGTAATEGKAIATPGGGTASTPMSVSNAVTACSAGSANVVTWKYY